MVAVIFLSPSWNRGHVAKPASKKTSPTPAPGVPRRRRWWITVTVGLALLWLAGWGFREFALGRCERAIALRDYPTATAWLQRAAWLGSATARQCWLQARIDRKLGRMEAFTDSIVRAEKAGIPREKIGLERLLAMAQAGQSDELNARMGRLLVEQNEDASEICEAFVLGCLLNFRFQDAKRVLDVWQSDYADDPQPHYLRGRILEHDNEYDAAEKEYRMALKLQPRHPAAAFNLGRLLMVRQKPAEAREVYATCAKLLQYPQAAWVGVGRAERASGHVEEARQWLRQANEGTDRPEVQEVFRWLGEPAESAQSQAPAELGQLELDQQNFGEAVRWLEKAVNANPRDWKIRHAYATALRAHGDLERATVEFALVEDYRSAWQRLDRLFDQLHSNPNSADIRTQIGAAFLQYYSENQGLVWLNSAVSLDPDATEAHRLLADYFDAHRDENPQFPELADQHRRKANAPKAPRAEATP
jgi:Tfp pilus assembly protein PilF